MRHLAELLRPRRKTWQRYVGQSHLAGPSITLAISVFEIRARVDPL